MIIGWADLIRRPFARPRTDFVSVDARRYSNNPKTYEMINSPPSRQDNMPKYPEPVVTSPLPKENGLSPLAQSPDSNYTNDYLSKDFEHKPSTFGEDADYKSPKLSFSKPRPPSAGRGISRENSTSFLQRLDGVGRPFSPERDSPGSLGGRLPPARRDSGGRFPSVYEWDPASTHAKSSRRQDPYGL